jgi:hypothetical protein
VALSQRLESGTRHSVAERAPCATPFNDGRSALAIAARTVNAPSRAC